MNVRPATREDTAAIGQIAEATELFPASLLPGMIETALAGGDDVWLVAEGAGRITGFIFASPEEITDRTWNILAIGVHPDGQGQGAGRALLVAAEAMLGSARLIVIETSQLPGQAAARGLYQSAGYSEEGTVRDFYEDGVDKVIFRKALPGSDNGT
ncbi:MAG: N-acetyltransferase [Pseudomonadota bacterium]